jgi:hypothetical protein
MNSLIVNPIFSLSGADSRALTMLAVVVHPVSEPGVYRGTIVAAAGDERDFTLVVDANDVAQSVAIDLAGAAHAAGAGCGCERCTGEAYRTAPGYVAFQVGSGIGRYSVRLARANSSEGNVFDSRLLGAGDIFAATLLRPGRYRATELEHRHTATIQVVRLGDRDRSVLHEPVRISADAHGFSERQLEIVSSQGLVVEVRAKAAILIEPEWFDDHRKAAARKA